MTEYLIQKPSGHIYVATDILRKRSDMEPYAPEAPKDETQEEETPEATTVEETSIEQEDDLASLKAEYREWFGRPAPPRAKIETLKAKIAEAKT